MGWDSNPRWTCAHAGFQDRCLKPLGHPSNFVNQLAELLSALSSRMAVATILLLKAIAGAFYGHLDCSVNLLVGLLLGAGVADPALAP